MLLLNVKRIKMPKITCKDIKDNSYEVEYNEQDTIGEFFQKLNEKLPLETRPFDSFKREDGSVIKADSLYSYKVNEVLGFDRSIRVLHTGKAVSLEEFAGKKTVQIKEGSPKKSPGTPSL